MPEYASRMERADQHLSPTRIRQFAEGIVVLQPGELMHFNSCDQCSDTWWKIRQELKRQTKDHKTDKSA
jgi:hypothetical protein